MHDKCQMQRCRCMWTRNELEICLEEHDTRDREKRQTFVAAHVMFADACCIIKGRSWILRFDPRSVHELGNSITLPSLDD